MPDGRPPIPAEIRRAVLVEAGHRCAIPTCRHNRVEIAHIEPYHKVKRHDLVNLIALCPNCHDRFDRGEIDRQSVRRYKANLSIINAQYGELERRIIEMFAADPDAFFLNLPRIFELFVWNLVRDGYLEPVMYVQPESGHPYLVTDAYRITPAGREFVAAYSGGQDLDAARPVPTPRTRYFAQPLDLIKDIMDRTAGRIVWDRFRSSKRLAPPPERGETHP